MAATNLDIQSLPKSAIAGFPHQIIVTARDSGGAPFAGYTGTVTFTSDDPDAILPAPYTFVGGDAGVHVFRVRFEDPGPHTLKVDDGSIVAFVGHTNVVLRPPGWGLDDEGILPYGDAVAGIGAHIVSAHVVSTRQVAVTVSNFVLDNSPFIAGDALNPATWTLQRLDSNEFLHVVSVEQTGTYTYTLLTLEEFGPVEVTHKVGSTTLLDEANHVLNSPQYATFLGITDVVKSSIDEQLAAQQVTVRDIANPQLGSDPFLSGTLQIGGDCDYLLESGASLIRKLILRLLMTTPGDFFHIPTYGLGVRVKEPIPPSDLGRLKTAIETQVQAFPEVSSANASITLDSNGILTVKVRAIDSATGLPVEVGYSPSQQGRVP